jgi:hypothetical protein
MHFEVSRRRFVRSVVIKGRSRQGQTVRIVRGVTGVSTLQSAPLPPLESLNASEGRKRSQRIVSGAQHGRIRND